MEDLQDNPKECKKKIIEYLTMYADKIEKIEIETEINETTLSPIVVLKCFTTVAKNTDILSKLL
jgi:hypothetical protein